MRKAKKRAPSNRWTFNGGYILFDGGFMNAECVGELVATLNKLGCVLKAKTVKL